MCPVIFTIKPKKNFVT